MKLILLRHEDREFDIGFFSNLTNNGMINSIKLKQKLIDLNIDIIYSSPFIRTIQTIFPYCIDNNKKINLDYGLYEYIHNPYFLLGEWYYTIDDIKDIDLISIINTRYTSIVNKDDFHILEFESNLENRIKKFINELKLIHNDNETILLVTHKGVVNKIKDIYYKKTDLESPFDMGKFEIFNINL